MQEEIDQVRATRGCWEREKRQGSKRSRSASGLLRNREADQRVRQETVKMIEKIVEGPKA